MNRVISIVLLLLQVSVADQARGVVNGVRQPLDPFGKIPHASFVDVYSVELRKECIRSLIRELGIDDSSFLGVKWISPCSYIKGLHLNGVLEKWFLERIAEPITQTNLYHLQTMLNECFWFGIKNIEPESRKIEEDKCNAFLSDLLQAAADNRLCRDTVFAACARVYSLRQEFDLLSHARIVLRPGLRWDFLCGEPHEICVITYPYKGYELVRTLISGKDQYRSGLRYIYHKHGLLHQLVYFLFPHLGFTMYDRLSKENFDIVRNFNVVSKTDTVAPVSYKDEITVDSVVASMFHSHSKLFQILGVMLCEDDYGKRALYINGMSDFFMSVSMKLPIRCDDTSFIDTALHDTTSNGRFSFAMFQDAGFWSSHAYWICLSPTNEVAPRIRIAPNSNVYRAMFTAVDWDFDQYIREVSQDADCSMHEIEALYRIVQSVLLQDPCNVKIGLEKYFSNLLCNYPKRSTYVKDRRQQFERGRDNVLRYIADNARSDDACAKAHMNELQHKFGINPRPKTDS